MKKNTYLWIIITFLVLGTFFVFFLINNQRGKIQSENDLMINTYRERVWSLKQAIAQELKLSEDQLYNDIALEEGVYVKGVYVLENQEAGIFLAKRNENSWKLTYLKNEVYSCQEAEKFDFPKKFWQDCLK